MFKTNLTKGLMACALSLAFSASYAQPFFTEDFEGTLGTNGLPTNWTETGNSAPKWAVDDNTNAASQYVAFPAHTKFAYVNDDDCNCDMSAERMILPMQDFTPYTIGVSIAFEYYSQQYYGSEWDLQVSTDNGATWTSVYTDGANTTAWTDKVIDLSAYAGQDSILVAFQYRDAGQWAGGLGVDNVELRPAYNNDIAVGLPSVDGNGWNRDYIRITGFQYHPQNQIAKSELLFGATVTNRGVNDATNVVVTVNVDRFSAPNTFTNVYTDTIQLGTVPSDSIAWAVKDMSDSTWATVGSYRYWYVNSMDSIDQDHASDTVVGYFDITTNFWSKVDKANDGGPYGDNAYLPGVTAPNYVSYMEWGTMYYLPHGAGYVLDTLTVRLASANSANATIARFQGRIYKVVDNGDGQFNVIDDVQLKALVADSVTVTAGANYTKQLTNFIDFGSANFDEYVFENEELYYISIFQEVTGTPGLNDGTVRNGLYVYGQTINHDGFVYGASNLGFQFYNPLMVKENNAATATAYDYGWTGGPEPSIFLNLAPANTSVQQTATTELSGVEVFPNPTSKEFNVNLSLAQASDVRFILTDVTGRVIDLKFAKNISNETRTWDIANFPAGVYFLHVKANGLTTTKRIVKQ